MCSLLQLHYFQSTESERDRIIEVNAGSVNDSCAILSIQRAQVYTYMITAGAFFVDRTSYTELKITGGHWTFSMQFSIMATQNLIMIVAIVYRWPIKRFHCSEMH